MGITEIGCKYCKECAEIIKMEEADLVVYCENCGKPLVRNASMHRFRGFCRECYEKKENEKARERMREVRKNMNVRT